MSRKGQLKEMAEWAVRYRSASVALARWMFRTLNVLDDFNCEGLAIEVDFSLPTERVVRALE